MKKNIRCRIITVVVAIVATAAQSYGQQAVSSTGKESNNRPEQDYCPSETSIWGAGGLSTLNYNPEVGSRSNMLGGLFGVGYSYYWSRSLGFLLGTELALFQSESNRNSLQDNYEELQRLWSVNIPLMLQYQRPLLVRHHLYAGLGFKLGIPLDASYKASHFGESSSGGIDPDLSYMGALEAGIKWSVGSNMGLYTNLFFDYTFNDIMKDNHLMTTRVSPVTFGVKLRLGTGICPEKKQAIGKEVHEKFSMAENRQAPVSGQNLVRTVGLEENEENEELVMTRGRLGNEEIGENLRRLIYDYGPSFRDVASIELEGFRLNKSALTPDKERILDGIVNRIRRTYGTNISIICEGHTCDLGSVAFNMRLGERRAEEVRRFLISRGFRPERITTVSKGPFVPLVPNTSEANRQRNRRVVLIIRD